MSSTQFVLGRPTSLEYSFELEDGPVVPTLWTNRHQLLKVDRVDVTAFADGKVHTTARGFIIKQDGERDKRYAQRETASMSTASAFTSYFIGHFSDHALDVLGG